MQIHQARIRPSRAACPLRAHLPVSNGALLFRVVGMVARSRKGLRQSLDMISDSLREPGRLEQAQAGRERHGRLKVLKELETLPGQADDFLSFGGGIVDTSPAAERRGPPCFPPSARDAAAALVRDKKARSGKFCRLSRGHRVPRQAGWPFPRGF